MDILYIACNVSYFLHIVLHLSYIFLWLFYTGIAYNVLWSYVLWSFYTCIAYTCLYIGWAFSNCIKKIDEEIYKKNEEQSEEKIIEHYKNNEEKYKNNEEMYKQTIELYIDSVEIYEIRNLALKHDIKCVMPAIVVQKWFRRILLSRCMMKLIPKLIPIYYEPTAKGGYFAKKDIAKAVGLNYE